MGHTFDFLHLLFCVRYQSNNGDQLGKLSHRQTDSTPHLGADKNRNFCTGASEIVGVVVVGDTELGWTRTFTKFGSDCWADKRPNVYCATTADRLTYICNGDRKFVHIIIHKVIFTDYTIICRHLHAASLYTPAFCYQKFNSAFCVCVWM